MIRTSHSGFPVAALTHPGMSGKNNEDRYAVSAFRLSKRSRKPVLLAVLTDGIGGHRAGEVAAEIATERISQAVAASSGAQPVETLRQAITQASQEIYTLATSDPARQGMGTTCVCAWIIENRLYTATVGDSRMYLIRKGGIQQLSTDHTWVQEAIEIGSLKPEQVKGHPNQHVIRRYIGSPNPPEVDFRIRLEESGDLLSGSELNQGLLLHEGDILVLTSDGLTDLVNDREILAQFRQTGLDPAIRALIDMANQRGGHDNITVIAIEIPRRTLIERLATSKSLFRAAVVGAAVLALVLFTGLLAGFSWLNNHGDEGNPTAAAETLQPTQGLPVILPSETPLNTATPSPAATPLPAVTLIPTATAQPTATRAPTAAPLNNANTPTAWPTNTVAPSP
jgi:PPM family protein phosphatase